MAAEAVDKIKKDINDEKTRRSNLTRADLEKSYLELESNDFDSGMRIKFAADLAEIYILKMVFINMTEKG